MLSRSKRAGTAGAAVCLAALVLTLHPIHASAQSHHTGAHHQAHTDHGGMHDNHADHHGHGNHHSSAAAVAPIGVMGDHMMPKGKWMTSYRYMRMNMEGNRIGTNKVSPSQIATTIPNTNTVTAPNGNPFTPPFLRVVPTKMTMEMHMFGLMYAPTNNITLMAMLNYIEKEMDHITFLGPMGDTVKGTFTTKSEGIGDTTLSALIRLFDQGNSHVHFNAGISIPTGSLNERDFALRPFPTALEPGKVEQRLPYAMQLGTGTWDLLPGITYTDRAGDLSWGLQYMARVHLGTNDEGYSWGDKHAGTGWLAYQFAPWISASFRVAGSTQQRIDGRDDQINAPIQTAYPEFYGGEKVELFAGLNLAGQDGILKGHRLAFEIGKPVYQNLNGPQMETDLMFTLGWQKTF